MERETKGKPHKDFLTSREAANMLGVALSTVQLWTESGVLHAWKTGGGHRRIARDSVERMLLEQRDALDRAHGDESLTVVVVEDAPAQRKLYRRQFEARKLPVSLITASNGFDGLVQIGRVMPDVIITDLLMPGMDGFAMLDALGSMPALKNTLTIVISGLSDAEIAEQGGVRSTIPVYRKPVSFDALETLLRRQLAKMGGHTGLPES